MKETTGKMLLVLLSRVFSSVLNILRVDFYTSEGKFRNHILVECDGILPRFYYRNVVLTQQTARYFKSFRPCFSHHRKFLMTTVQNDRSTRHLDKVCNHNVILSFLSVIEL